MVGRMDPMWLALSKLRRGEHKECISLCDELLETNPRDQAAWLVKCRAVTEQNYIDDIELDEEGVADFLMDEHSVSAVPRPGTSLSAPRTSSGASGGPGSASDAALRPVSHSGRPLTGFTRPMSASARPGSGQAGMRDALQSRSNSGRLGTAGARPMTNAGREIRLGTASLAASGTGPLVDLSRLNVPKYARRPAIAMALVDYMLYVERNTRKALELSAEATSACGFKDWFWKARLGKCYFKLGLLRDAEQQFKSALRDQPHIGTYLELCNVYLRMDLPITALEVLDEASGKFTLEPRLLLGTARVHEMLNDGEKALEYYKKTLALDASCIEAVACLGAHHFYAQQPELATRYYRRLIQMGVNNTEIWNNLGLCLFYAAQYDMSLGCLERALALANDASMADVWYNIGHVGVMLGDLGLSYQAFKVCVSIDPCHGEALNNIGVLEMRRQKTDAARTYFTLTQETNSQLFEPHYNAALMAYREGNFQEAYMQAKEALKLFPDHQDSKELLLQLQKTFALP